MKSKEQLIIEHNMLDAEAEARYTTIRNVVYNEMTRNLEIRRLMLAHEMRLMAECQQFQIELEALNKKFNK